LIALTIAGSDSSGGAGIQADLKTFAAHSVYGTTVITAITAQNTLTVSAVETVSAQMVVEQLRAVFDDLPVRSLKTGMLANAEIVVAVANFLKEKKFSNIVIDPVMISKSNHRLLSADAENALKTQLLPLAL